MNAARAPLRGRGYHPTVPQLHHLAPLHPRLYEDINGPCHFLKLPTELRQEIFRYAMPECSIEQECQLVCTAEHEYTSCAERARLDRIATPVLNLLLGFNREIYHEVKDVVYSTATFVIRIGRSGVEFCKRRILGPLEPIGQHGSVYPDHGMDPRAIALFIQQFPWEKIRKYQINLAFRQGKYDQDTAGSSCVWDSEVELYDIRDYAADVVSGILSKARQLDRLQVRIKMTDTHPDRESALHDAKVLIKPFERLRCVRNPQLMGIYKEKEDVNTSCLQSHLCSHCSHQCVSSLQMPLRPLFLPGMASFDHVAARWEQKLASEAPFKLLPSSPLTKLFVEFKEFHNKLIAVVPGIARRGSQSFLHQARIAREREDVALFRAVAAELMACWHHHVQLHEAQMRDVNGALERMVAADTYPRARAKRQR